jgi:hypothetical protein
MGMFSWFRKSPRPATISAPVGSRKSVAAFLSLADTKPAIARCGVLGCGLSFASLGSGHIYTMCPDDFVLDCGGFCPSCRYYVCPKHARFSVKPAQADGSFPSLGSMDAYGVHCERCGSELWTSKENFTRAHEKAIEQESNLRKADNEAAEKLRRLRGIDEQIALQLVADAPNLKQYINVVRQEARLDFSQAEKERLSIAKALERLLPKNELDDLVKRSMELKAGTLKAGNYQSYLRELCRRTGIDLTRYQTFEVYVDYLVAVEAIDKVALQQELDRLTI